MKKTTIELLKKADYSITEIASCLKVMLVEAKENHQEFITLDDFKDAIEHIEEMSADAINFSILATASESVSDTEKAIEEIESNIDSSCKLAKGILAKYEL